MEIKQEGLDNSKTIKSIVYIDNAMAHNTSCLDSELEFEVKFQPVNNVSMLQPLKLGITVGILYVQNI